MKRAGQALLADLDWQTRRTTRKTPRDKGATVLAGDYSNAVRRFCEAVEADIAAEQSKKRNRDFLYRCTARSHPAGDSLPGPILSHPL
jgi:hypothetical protein